MLFSTQQNPFPLTNTNRHNITYGKLSYPKPPKPWRFFLLCKMIRANSTTNIAMAASTSPAVSGSEFSKIENEDNVLSLLLNIRY